MIPADVQAQRLGPEPPDSFPLLRDRFENSLLALAWDPAGAGLTKPEPARPCARDSARSCMHLLKPLGAILVEEIREKLDPAAGLNFAALRAGDIAGSARAFNSLVSGGLTPQSAAAVVGLDGVSVREVSP